ncbi:unnamed protein product, partial [Polarella glacialis]
SAAPQLAALLLKSQGRDGFAGKDFMTLVHPDDRELLIRQFDQKKNATPVQLLRVRMPDSNGHLVNVQVFHTPFLEIDDRCGHLLGLQEESVEEAETEIAFQRTENRRTNKGGVNEEKKGSEMPEGAQSAFNSGWGQHCKYDEMASAHHHELASYSQFMHPTDETS